ncbi:MAG TPA: TIGR02281 family clan AA aspartic protease [Methylophilaceae bacterium]|nr:TIGR02281 family clan AA aspartic protease [Methylophilaceae bacterium]
MLMQVWRLVLSLLCLAISLPILAETQINIVGLFNGKAVVMINNGRPKTLSVGQSAEGVKLISADSKKAVLEVEGRRQELGMGQAASVSGSTASVPGSAVLYADPTGHYFTDAQINGVTLKLLVDTGASVVAMNSSDARRAGIDYKQGKRVSLQTANGAILAYEVVVNTLKLGSVVLHQVNAVVNEGDSPPVVLLGMSALNRMDMKREGVTLTLTKKY